MPKPKTKRAVHREKSLPRHGGSSIEIWIRVTDRLGHSVVETEDVIASFDTPIDASDKEIYFLLIDALSIRYRTLAGVRAPLLREYHSLHCQQ